MTDNFADHPKSISELRSDRSHNGADWTPRDALIDVLREIDSGRLKADAMVICIRETLAPGQVRSRFRSAAADAHVALGLMFAVQMQLQSQAEE